MLIRSSFLRIYLDTAVCPSPVTPAVTRPSLRVDNAGVRLTPSSRHLCFLVKYYSTCRLLSIDIGTLLRVRNVWLFRSRRTNGNSGLGRWITSPNFEPPSPNDSDGTCSKVFSLFDLSHSSFVGLFDVIHRTGWIPDTLVQRAVSTPVRGRIPRTLGNVVAAREARKIVYDAFPSFEFVRSGGVGGEHTCLPGGGTYSTTGNTRDKIIIQHGISVRRANA